MSKLEFFHININRLSGTIPVAVGHFQALYEFVAHDNELSGSIPDALMSVEDLVINDNRLTGSLSTLDHEVLILD